jgi:hypothetical protein
VFLRRIIGLGVLVTALAAASATYALAASQELTETASPAVATGSGVSVVDASYEVDEQHRERIAAVLLRLASPARGTVLTTLDGGKTWLECTAKGSALRCPTRGMQLGVQDAAGLSIAPAL